ncbi:MAG: DegT/DnrJ/EryC1/StrS family aminotransferase [Chloroflexi bacterium]|nr:DegT/DnrJ/EryC1/StrS family aminotransferase [Chloroflexota bacterium]
MVQSKIEGLQAAHKGGKYAGNELKYVKSFLDNEKKPWTLLLEKAFAERFGARYAIAHNSGTSALHSCLATAGVGPGDEVISPALTVIMDALVTLHQNAVPVFADIDPDTFNIDPADIRRKITSRTKAIIAVSLYGLPADIGPIMEIAREHNLTVIEDSAQCVLGMYHGRIAGTIGHMGCFSLERTKHLPTGEGGMVLTNDERLAERVRKFGGIGYKNLKAEEGRMQVNPSSFQDPDYKRHDFFGWNYRMPEICAAVGLAQVERVDEIVAQRQAIARLYEEAIAGCDWLVPQKTPPGLVNSYYTYAVKFEGAAAPGMSWKEFYNLHVEMGGDRFYSAWSVPYFEPVLIQAQFYGKDCPTGCPWYNGQVSWERGLCPHAEAIQPKMMQFKTNYRNMELAREKIGILKKTIARAEGRK